ncbi:MAG: M48 family metallopeptidase [Acidobacteria bacterium]|nr:M48 family metallopeptidase [Acidobacteriota bacterium]
MRWHVLTFALIVGAICIAPSAVAGAANARPAGFGQVAQVKLQVPEGAVAGPDFNVDRATRAYLDLLTPEQRRRSDAYFEGGYWIRLWTLLYGLAIAAVLLFGRVAARLRDRTRWTRFPALNAGFFGVGYAIFVAVLTLPWTIYTGFIREHHYGLATQTFSAWFRDWGVGLAVSAVLSLIALWVLYAVFRRVGQSWWLWGSVVGLMLLAVVMAVAPVYIAPLFNNYQPLPQGHIRSRILSLARANGIPAENVYWFDASRQTNRISANVSGLGPTTRISLNDNLLTRQSEEGIEAVMAHEMGHYVLHHAFRLIIDFGLLLVIGFACVAWAFRRLVARFGGRWGVSGVADPAGWPLIVALFAVFFFLMTPMVNTTIRTAEQEADYFGLNAAQQPDGFAMAAISLAEYRKLEPGPVERFIFYDHPSGYDRVHAAMQWKAEHLANYGVTSEGQAVSPEAGSSP